MTAGSRSDPPGFQESGCGLCCGLWDQHVGIAWYSIKVAVLALACVKYNSNIDCDYGVICQIL